MENMQMHLQLPEYYESINHIPQPSNKVLRINRMKRIKVASRKFTGKFSIQIGLIELEKLLKSLKDDNFITDSSTKKNFVCWMAQYNPTFGISFLRKNEVWIELSCDC
jgi:hypothetical protein